MLPYHTYPYMIICESWVLAGAVPSWCHHSEDFDHFASGIPEHFRLRQFKSLKKHPAVLTKCAERLPSCFLQGMSTLTNCRNLSKAWCATTRSHLLLEVNTRGRAKVHGAAQSVHQVHYAESVSSIAAEPLQQIADWGWFFFFYSKFRSSSGPWAGLASFSRYLHLFESCHIIPYPCLDFPIIMLFSDAVGAKILAQDLNILKLRQPAERHLLKMAASVALYQDKFVEIYADHIKIKSYYAPVFRSKRINIGKECRVSFATDEGTGLHKGRQKRLGNGVEQCLVGSGHEAGIRFRRTQALGHRHYRGQRHLSKRFQRWGWRSSRESPRVFVAKNRAVINHPHLACSFWAWQGPLSA